MISFVAAFFFLIAVLVATALRLILSPIFWLYLALRRISDAADAVRINDTYNARMAEALFKDDESQQLAFVRKHRKSFFWFLFHNTFF